jgi:hypothetical protein
LLAIGYGGDGHVNTAAKPTNKANNIAAGLVPSVSTTINEANARKMEYATRTAHGSSMSKPCATLLTKRANARKIRFLLVPAVHKQSDQYQKQSQDSHDVASQEECCQVELQSKCDGRSR